LSAYDDIIHVDDASKLSEPNIDANIWGILSVNGERIMYRERDTINNTVSSLMRGTAGTANGNEMIAGDLVGVPLVHPVKSAVYDIGRGNLLPQEYQNKIVSSTSRSNGLIVTYTIPEANSSSILPAEVEVYIGGIRQTSGYTVTSVTPVTVQLNSVPNDSLDVTILVRQGSSWYEPGPGTPSNGVPLQNTNTIPARFLRGL
jgi:hypothetical protein